MSKLIPWSAIVVTATSPTQAQSYQQEMNRLQQKGLIAEQTIVLAVPDPSSERIGSGGATLNALLTVTEYLSARKGLSYIDPELLFLSKILIIHSGGDSQRIPLCLVTGKAFSSFPFEIEPGEMASPFLLLMKQITTMTTLVEAGMVVASGDVLLYLPEKEFSWNQGGVTGVAIPADVSYAADHGVYKISLDENLVEAFYQKPSLEVLTEQSLLEDGNILLDSGILYFCPETTRILLSLNVVPPLDACSYLGVDNGALPLRIELYSDILVCLVQGTDQTEYFNMPSDATSLNALRAAREKLWENLHELSFHAIIVDEGEFAHIGTSKEYVELFTKNVDFHQLFGFQRHVRSHVEAPELEENAVIINSLLTGVGKAEPYAVIEHSELKGNWHVCEGAVCSGIRSYYGICIKKNIVLKEISLSSCDHEDLNNVVILYGVYDAIKLHYKDEKATFANQPWSQFLTRHDLNSEEIWPEVLESTRTLWTAKLFPVLRKDDWLDAVLWMQNPKPVSSATLKKWRASKKLSLFDILKRANPVSEFAWWRTLSHKIDLHLIENCFQGREQHEFVLPLLKRCVMEGQTDILVSLDSLAMESESDVAARIFSTIADSLALLANNQGGLRSGPMRNQNWISGFNALERGKICQAVQFLASERIHWLNSPERLIRAARHYEGAAQVLIRNSVQTVPIRTMSSTPAPSDEWVTIELPARIDLAGGWSDTPPITYEHGGVVVNMAVTLDGKKPIGVRVRRIQEPKLLFHLGQNSQVICRNLDEIMDYAQPLAPAALCKAALIVTQIIDIDSKKSLEEQLKEIGGGLEIETWSSLPTGSGLGTSSILSAGLLHVLGRVTGVVYDEISLIHAVLVLEQLLTTGGGWQDQVGGLIPGVKIAHSSGSLPLTVEYNILNLSEAMIQALNKHCLLVYTGRTRLARNLLQNVIRRWYARYPEIVGLVEDLTANAYYMKECLESEDLEGVGFCLNTYWDQKKQMASGAEPHNVTQMIDVIRPYVYGCSLTGAGGGGYMILILRDPKQRKEVEMLLNRISISPLRISEVAVSMEINESSSKSLF